MKHESCEVFQRVSWSLPSIVARTVTSSRRLGTQFLVKWKGYPKSEASWEPAAHCSGCPELVEQFRLSKAAAAPANKKTAKKKTAAAKKEGATTSADSAAAAAAAPSTAAKETSSSLPTLASLPEGIPNWNAFQRLHPWESHENWSEVAQRWRQYQAAGRQGLGENAAAEWRAQHEEPEQPDPDINNASKAQLARVGGIGKKMAKAIVEARTTGGPFTGEQDLIERVALPTGGRLGAGKLAALRDAGIDIPGPASGPSYPFGLGQIYAKHQKKKPAPRKKKAEPEQFRVFGYDIVGGQPLPIQEMAGSPCASLGPPNLHRPSQDDHDDFQPSLTPFAIR